MGFGIFALFISVLVPLIMLGAGKLMRDCPPKTINCIYGYRTKRSMKSQETWDFAHKHIGKTWIRCSFPAILLTCAAFMPLLGQSEDLISIVSLVLMAAQILLLILSVIPTEKALKKTFDENGNRK